eukprot:TRINITY_DN18954_c0_g1_i3.p1 TRINITY_DN18954_c0_g1~~TRINITY_DN18954_c0_g1_i3.p1  ORF type:complete len:1034 (+),score=247.42 TRINITY_DN18954_c0_g1_i3:655-3756(+)
MVCVLLWLMDEYWYYSLVTLFMLLLLEYQVVQRRLYDLSELRAMRIPPRPMHVFRGGNWRAISSDHVMPGDIIALYRGSRGEAQLSCPCDVLLLSGNVLVNEAMLTGESVPQMKVAVSVPADSEDARVPLDMKGRHKQSVVSAGTCIMTQEADAVPKAFKRVPNNGCVGYVLRTGFDTTQGKLVRTILFSTDRVTASSKESYVFLGVLMMFAVFSCLYILHDGLVVTPQLIASQADQAAECAILNASGNLTGNVTNGTDGSNETSRHWCEMLEKPRSTFKLVLAVSHILTSVVPPEFPITLSLAVNLSLVALVRQRVFCTEPFRVPLAGKVDLCCFDKTGTLTSDAMEVDRVDGLGKEYPKPKAKQADDESPASAGLQQPLPFLTAAVMAACSGLTVVDGEVVGDPLEKAAIQAVKWQMPSPGFVVSRPGKGADRLQIVARNPFASELQRMSVLVKHSGPGRDFPGAAASEAEEKGPGNYPPDALRALALVKGSCEALRPMLREVPKKFDALQDELSRQGLRVLCLAAKEMPDSALKGEPPAREALERDLEFCGLLVLRNAIKPHSAQVVRSLRRSYYRVMMITGDHPLTACQVAFDVDMADKPFLTLGVGEENGSADGLVWKRRGTERGAGEEVVEPYKASSVAELAQKYSLCVPGVAMTSLNEAQLCEIVRSVTVFARVTPQQKQQVLLAANDGGLTSLMAGDGTNDVGALKHAHVGVSLLSRAPDFQAEFRAMRQEMDATGMVRLGDASIASPFTYKGDTVKCCSQILKCGRATLCTVLMMYKIMGLNSVLSAFAMSALTLDGVKFGDGQTAIESIFISGCFFMVSRNSPAKKLAKQQPISSVFHWSVMLSLALQLAVHLTVLLLGWQLATAHRPAGYTRDLEGEFKPNLTNTVIFELTAAMHISSFLANYEGRPFMQPLTENRPLLAGMAIFIATLFACAAEIVPELNEFLTLVESPSEDFRTQLLTLLACDILGSVLLARSVTSLATWLRGRSAEAAARENGLGFGGDEAEGGRGKDNGKDKESKKKR